MLRNEDLSPSFLLKADDSVLRQEEPDFIHVVHDGTIRCMGIGKTGQRAAGLLAEEHVCKEHGFLQLCPVQVLAFFGQQEYQRRYSREVQSAISIERRGLGCGAFQQFRLDCCRLLLRTFELVYMFLDCGYRAGGQVLAIPLQ